MQRVSVDDPAIARRTAVAYQVCRRCISQAQDSLSVALESHGQGIGDEDPGRQRVNFCTVDRWKMSLQHKELPAP